LSIEDNPMMREAGWSQASFTPAAAAYSAGDVMDVAKEFTGIAPPTGGIITFISTTLLVAHTDLISGEAGYSLNLYSVTPPSAHADNAVWDVPAGDRASYLGTLSLGTPADIGSSLWVEQNGVLKMIKVPASPNGGSIFGELVTVGGFTPTAAARTVTLLCTWH
jgi:hypothetical protein